MSGESRGTMLDRFGRISVAPARHRGTLFAHADDYPALVLDGETRIHGELHRFRDVEAMLREADEIEGFEGFDRAGSLFLRRAIEVQGQRAWVYLWAGDTAGLVPIASGSWRTHRGR